MLIVLRASTWTRLEAGTLGLRFAGRPGSEAGGCDIVEQQVALEAEQSPEPVAQRLFDRVLLREHPVEGS